MKIGTLLGLEESKRSSGGRCYLGGLVWEFGGMDGAWAVRGDLERGG